MVLLLSCVRRILHFLLSLCFCVSVKRDDSLDIDDADSFLHQLFKETKRGTQFTKLTSGGFC